MSDYKPTAPKPESVPEPESSNCGIPGYAEYPSEHPFNDPVHYWPKVVTYDETGHPKTQTPKTPKDSDGDNDY
jgi:hypothetical protein